jgi:antirestriction protein ArdC
MYGFSIDRFNEKMIAAFEKADTKWTRPWSLPLGGYVNAITGRTYRGVLTFILATSDNADCRLGNR